MDNTFLWRGEEVRVKEKVKLESMVDPVVLSLESKLLSLEGMVGWGRGLLATVRALEDGGGEDVNGREGRVRYNTHRSFQERQFPFNNGASAKSYHMGKLRSQAECPR